MRENDEKRWRHSCKKEWLLERTLRNDMKLAKYFSKCAYRYSFSKKRPGERGNVYHGQKRRNFVTVNMVIPSLSSSSHSKTFSWEKHNRQLNEPRMSRLKVSRMFFSAVGQTKFSWETGKSSKGSRQNQKHKFLVENILLHPRNSPPSCCKSGKTKKDRFPPFDVFKQQWRGSRNY